VTPGEVHRCSLKIRTEACNSKGKSRQILLLVLYHSINNISIQPFRGPTIAGAPDLALACDIYPDAVRTWINSTRSRRKGKTGLATAKESLRPEICDRHQRAAREAANSQQRRVYFHIDIPKREPTPALSDQTGLVFKGCIRAAGKSGGKRRCSTSPARQVETRGSAVCVPHSWDGVGGATSTQKKYTFTHARKSHTKTHSSSGPSVLLFPLSSGFHTHICYHQLPSPLAAWIRQPLPSPPTA
jgi:hypothetical protein